VQLDAKLAELMAADPQQFETTAYERRHDRERLERIDVELADLDERIGALQRRLPSDEEVASAHERAEKLCTEAEAAVARFGEEWQRLLHHLGKAETVGSAVAATMQEARRLQREANALAEEFDLEDPRLVLPSVPRNETKLAGLQAALVKSVAYSQTIRETTARDLAAARKQQEAA
jgi:DNA repair exonuclease SbcCD ATPase subunit